VSNSLDRLFIYAKQWLLSLLTGAPDWVIQISSALINIFTVLGVFLTLFALMSVLERKILGRMQNRYGPNRVGPCGLFQPVADGIKMLIKEDIVPARADKIVHFLAPILIAATAILALGVIPYGRNMTPFAIDGGILFFFAVGSTTELAVFMAGWGSNNKFSMLGAMRAIAQMVSYELPLLIVTLPAVMVVGSLSPDAIVAAHVSFRRRSTATFIVIAILTLVAALAAAALPKLIHAALSFAVTFVGIAAFFFLLGAEFVGLVQVFVYIGAVAVLIVFTILLTRRDVGKDRDFNWVGVFVAIAVFGGLVWAILKTQSVSLPPPPIEALTVKRIGEVLMTDYVWPLQCVGLLLTAALIGALILVMEEKRE
jgi:NADH:ubiquinone oxidoreductase subunit H